MDKWSRGQNGGNHCLWTEYRKKNNNKKKEYSLWDIWDNIKCTNICISGVPDGEGREKGPEKIFEDIIPENFPNMGKEIVNQI